MHGAGTIDAIEQKDILGEKARLLYNQNAWRSKSYGSIAKASDVGVRSVINKEEAGKSFASIRSKQKQKCQTVGIKDIKKIWIK